MTKCKCGSDNIETSETCMVTTTYDKDMNVTDRRFFGKTEVEFVCLNCGEMWNK